MWNRFAPRLRRMIFAALEEAGRRGQDEAWAEHLLLVIVRDSASAAGFILDDAGVNRRALEEVIERAFPVADLLPRRADKLSSFTLHVLDVADNESQKLGDRHVGTEHVMLALTQIRRGPAAQALIDARVSYRIVLDGRTKWRARGMPRIRSSNGRRLFGKLFRMLSLGWKVYIHKSIAHPRFASDPYPLYAKLRERWPVRRDPLAPVWIVTRYADVLTVMRDPRFCKDPFMAGSLPSRVREQLDLPASESVPVIGEPMAMLFIDPPKHTKIRSLFNRGFSTRALQLLRPRIEQICQKRIDRIEQTSNGRFDLMSELAYPLPTIVIAELMGFPPEDYPRLKKWSDDFAAALSINPSAKQQEASDNSREEMRTYFDEVVATLKRNPGENLISTLLGEGVDDEANGGLLTRQEFFANAALLLAAGHETTSNLIGNGMHALLRNPDQLRALRDDLSLITSAVEEMLRFDSPVQWTSRIAAEDVVLSDVTVPRSALILGSLGSANRDPQQFSDPDRFDIRRSDNKHIAFGQGIHYCLGATLARMEGEIAIGQLVARFPRLRLASRRVKWTSGVIFRGPKELLLRWD